MPSLQLVEPGCVKLLGPAQEWMNLWFGRWDIETPPILFSFHRFLPMPNADL